MTNEFGAYEIAKAVLIDCQFRDNGAWYDEINEHVGGASTDGQFNITVNGRRFSIHVSEYEDDQG